jgi:hypothetical protein
MTETASGTSCRFSTRLFAVTTICSRIASSFLGAVEPEASAACTDWKAQPRASDTATPAEPAEMAILLISIPPCVNERVLDARDDEYHAIGLTNIQERPDQRRINGTRTADSATDPTVVRHRRSFAADKLYASR